MKLQALCILGLNPIFTKTQIKFPSIQDEKAVVYTTYTFVKNYYIVLLFTIIMFAIVFICGCLLVLILACMYYIWQYLKQKMGTHKYFRVRKFS